MCLYGSIADSTVVALSSNGWEPVEPGPSVRPAVRPGSDRAGTLKRITQDRLTACRLVNASNFADRVPAPPSSPPVMPPSP